MNLFERTNITVEDHPITRTSIRSTTLGSNRSATYYQQFPEIAGPNAVKKEKLRGIL